MKVSIIIPVYNTEQYLDRCIGSVCGQTHEDLEIILVNDGSRDNSLAKCREWAEHDSRIIVIDQENNGQGSARNRGLDIMTGEYVVFVDSDDYVSRYMVEQTLKVALDYDSDFVQFNYDKVPFDATPENKEYEEIKDGDIILKRPECGNFVCYYEFDITPVNKLIHKSVVSGLRYLPGVFYEDKYYMLQARYYAKNIVYLDRVLYYYAQSPVSTMRSKIDDKRFRSHLIISEKVLEFCREHELDDYYLEEAGYLRKLLSLWHHARTEKQFSGYKKEVKERIKSYIPKWRKNKYLSVPYKIFVYMMSVNMTIPLTAFSAFRKLTKRKKDD